jgi:hypothetical protein
MSICLISSHFAVFTSARNANATKSKELHYEVYKRVLHNVIKAIYVKKHKFLQILDFQEGEINNPVVYNTKFLNEKN